MSNDFDLQKEEFIQNRLQYRWLDETRIKLIDRFFIILLAIMAARFQFDDFFECPYWLFAIYAFLVLVTSFMAKSIISFRRQQKGHNLYTKAIYRKILVSDDFSKFKAYVDGKKVYPIKYIEFLIVILSILTPFLFLEPFIKMKLDLFWAVLICTIMALVISSQVLLPFRKYYSEEIDWKKD